MFLGALRVAFLTFAALETGLEIEGFLRTSWGSWMAPENKEMSGSVVKTLLRTSYFIIHYSLVITLA